MILDKAEAHYFLDDIGPTIVHHLVHPVLRRELWQNSRKHLGYEPYLGAEGLGFRSVDDATIFLLCCV